MSTMLRAISGFKTEHYAYFAMLRGVTLLLSDRRELPMTIQSSLGHGCKDGKRREFF